MTVAEAMRLIAQHEVRFKHIATPHRKWKREKEKILDFSFFFCFSLFFDKLLQG
jgi:hypothetical protein